MQTLYLAPFFSFAVQTRRNTVFSAVPPAILEDSLRPIAKEARAGLLEFRILNEGPNRFTIDTSQFSRIFNSRWSLKTKHLWVAFKKLPFALAAAKFDCTHVIDSNQSSMILWWKFSWACDMLKKYGEAGWLTFRPIENFCFFFL